MNYPYGLLATIFLICYSSFASSQGVNGYYRFPTVHNGTIYFAAEGDLWKVSIDGGLAQRLTTHPGSEINPSVSPDGSQLAFSASYEGPFEVYVMPSSGGLPERLTYDQERSTVRGWTPTGDVLYETRKFSTLPQPKLVRINPKTYIHEVIPLSHASEGHMAENGELVFVNPAFHNNVTKRYIGGTARQVWKYTDGNEATKLTTDYAGESHHPKWWDGRIYFISDRDGIMNVWSMNSEGADLVQHTAHATFDVREMDLYNGIIVYRHGADLWKLDLATGASEKINITLATDLDQLREKWVEDPMNYVTSANISPDGSKVVFTARGRVFVSPAKGGRFVQISRKNGVRYRDATFMSDSTSILALSDESGEFEFVQIPANGIGEHKQLTDDGEILRYQGFPSPDGKWIAYDDLNGNMWLLDPSNGAHTKISTNEEGIGRIIWSPDSKWIVFEQSALNSFRQLMVYGLDNGETKELTTDRANSNNPAFSADGKFLYFMSDRHFRSLVGSPWGSRQPEPYFDHQIKIYELPLTKGLRSPFRPADELWNADEEEDDDSDELNVAIDFDRIQSRISEVPVDPGNYWGLQVNKNGLFWMSRTTGLNTKSALHAMKFSDTEPEAKPVIADCSGFSMSADGKKLLVRKGSSAFVVAAGTSKINDLSDSKVDLSAWKFAINVREDWRQIYKDAWRMERDYFYDVNMHGIDWDAMYEKYLPLLDRVTTRDELSDLIGRYVGELEALHTSVRGGDVRQGAEDIDVADLGAELIRNEAKGGYEIRYIYEADPDYPHERSPLADPYLDIEIGDVILAINGDSPLDVPDIGSLLRGKARQQVHLEILDSGTGTNREVILEPLPNSYNLRYRDWEYSRRQIVEEKGGGDLGYVHLRAMGSNDISQWYREFYPVYDRKGLIVDVRNNRGGNIESLILEKLMRKAWMWWAYRSGSPYRNMQYAFDGHMVVLVNEQTASDGELFAEGFRRLGMGEIIGTRTWGGEIWLSGVNRLSDNGIARAPMMGVYGLDGTWLIEGHGVDPDIVVENLPHATFNGSDAQLDAAIEYLKNKLIADPKGVPAPPAYPDKSRR